MKMPEGTSPNAHRDQASLEAGQGLHLHAGLEGQEASPEGGSQGVGGILQALLEVGRGAHIHRAQRQAAEQHHTADAQC